MSDNGEERTDLVVLIDEEGNEHDFALVDRFQVELKDYAILVPVLYLDDGLEDDDIDFEDDAYIFRIELDDGDEVLVEVEDEVEWNLVAALWEERMQGMELEEEEEDTY